MVLDPVMIARHNLKTTSLLNTVRHKTHDNGCSSDVHDLSDLRGEIRLAARMRARARARDHTRYDWLWALSMKFRNKTNQVKFGGETSQNFKMGVSAQIPR